MANNELKQTNHRAFIDKNGGYQSERTGSDKEAHDAWVKSNSWGLTRDDFIRLSYFHGDMEAGSDGTGPINGSEDRPGDVVYISQDGGAMTRSMVSYWFANSNSFMHGYKKALEAHTAQAEPSDAAPVDIYGRPVAWRVHLRAKGEAPTVDYDQPALFKVERSAIGWMHEQIDFKGWRGAWMEPLYLRPASARGQDAARLAFLHSTNKDADGWEWGVVRLRNVDGRVEYLWGLSDHSDIDAAIQAQAGEGAAT